MNVECICNECCWEGMLIELIDLDPPQMACPECGSVDIDEVDYD